MRLARHLAPGHSPKRLALRTMIRSQFDAVPSSSNAHTIETAKANGLEPYAYLRRVFTLLPAATIVADVEALLPWAQPSAT